MKKDFYKPVLKRVKSCCRVLLLCTGVMAMLLITGAFTSIPYHARVFLASPHNPDSITLPHTIVMLGGGGMPEEGNLMRLYYTARLALAFKEANIIIAHPFDSIVICRMRAELMHKGIDSARIAFVHQGANTRAQALAINDSLPQLAAANIALVTTPEQMLRSVLCFRKIGFKHIAACPTMQHNMNKGLLYNARDIGGRLLIPDMGQNLALRYNFWNYLSIEIALLRECCALAYYKLNGWV